jgi:hypothetical protein
MDHDTDERMVKLFDDVLCPEQCSEIYNRLISEECWSFTGHSTFREEGYMFWQHDLTNNDFYSDFFFNRILEITEQDFELVRVYANGQTYGQPGHLHVDGECTDTFLYYANPEWDVSWGGHTVFCNSETLENFSFLPKPNSALLFDSHILHCGMDPSRHCYDLRISIAFKLKRK